VRQRQPHGQFAGVPATQEEGDRTDAVVRLLYDSRTRWTTVWVRAGNGPAPAATAKTTAGSAPAAATVSPTASTWPVRFPAAIWGPAAGWGPSISIPTAPPLPQLHPRERAHGQWPARQEGQHGLRVPHPLFGQRQRLPRRALYLRRRAHRADAFHRRGTGALSIGSIWAPTWISAPSRIIRPRPRLKRTALGLSAGYGFDKLKIASALEYRVDDTEQPDAGSFSKRTTWLLKNSLKYQLVPDWRIIGKFNYAQSESSLGMQFMTAIIPKRSWATPIAPSP
jgi:hypothetical protein